MNTQDIEILLGIAEILEGHTVYNAEDWNIYNAIDRVLNDAEFEHLHPRKKDGTFAKKNEDEINYISEKYQNYKDFLNAYKNYIEKEPEDYKYNTINETLKDLGITKNNPLIVKTPLGDENITVNSIEHIINGGGNSHPPDLTRFKSINKMLETLKKPLLIIDKNDNHRYYFKIFQAKQDKTMNDMVIISPDDEIYTNFPIERGNWFFKKIITGNIKYDILNQ